MTPTAEAAQVAVVFEHTLRDGATWHVLPSEWWREWCSYTGFSADAGCVTASPAGPRPGPIDNSKLIDSAYASVGILRKVIQEGEDYVLVESRSATLLEGWYGLIGPSLARRVITVGLRKKTRVDLFPVFVRLIECDSHGVPDESTATIRSFTAKSLFSDVQEEQHNRVIEAERQQQAEQADAEDDKSSSLDALESRVRLWVRKPQTSEGALTSPIVSEPSTALVIASSPSGSDAADAVSSMEIDADAAEGVPSAAPAADAADASSSPSSFTPAFSGVYEREFKSSLTSPTSDSLDGEDALNPSDPNVRTARLPPPPLLVDEWRLVTEEELSESLDTLDLPSLSDVLVETQRFEMTVGADGSSDLGFVWPRAAHHRIKRWEEFDVGDVLDVKDTADDWHEAQILAIRPGAIFVRYKGWKDIWNAWVPLDQGRITEHHQHTSFLSSSSSYTSAPATYSSYRSGGYGYYSSNEDGKPEAPGAVGLKNLGFMASTLQCLSHCESLTDYFLDDAYLREINKTNPLGWGGRVAEEYGKLLKDMWSDKYTVVAPRDFKSIISEVQPRFEGYQQHDSSELLSFLLDGLHEDLNRVIKKPATATVDSNGRPDEVVAAEAWETYQLRNRSVIVDAMQGQLKSTVVCPIDTCSKVSITFDPFQFLSVPLPIAEDTVVTLHLVYADTARPVTKVGATVSKSARLSDLKAAICAAVGDIANPRHIVLADIFSSRVYRFFDDDSLVSDIKSHDVVYAYECPEIEEYIAKDSPAGGFLPVSILFHKREVNPPSYSRFSTRHDPYRFTACAQPRVICLPKKTQVMVRHILDAVHAKVAPHLRSSDSSPTAPLTPSELESGYEVIIADEKGADCGHHESLSAWSDKCDGCSLREYSLIGMREAAAQAAARAKTEATSSRLTGNLHTTTAISNTWEAFSNNNGDDSDKETDKTPSSDDSSDTSSTGSSSSAILVTNEASPTSSNKSDEDMLMPSPESSTSTAAVKASDASSDGTTDGFVKVEMADGGSRSDSEAVSEAATITPDIDVPFELKVSKSYTYMGEAYARCSFVVRVASVDAPSVETPGAVLVNAAPEGSVVPLDSDSDSLLDSPEGIASSETPSPSPAAPLVPWFESSSADRTILHASLDSVAKEHAESISILDCIRAFTKEETLSAEDPWYCSSCKEHRQATKKFDLFRLPSVLIIHLKRFSYSRYSRDKISTFVNFPIVGLELNDHVASASHAGEVYDLFAVSNHHGGLGGGHYTAFARNSTNGVWYLHDDSSVSRVRSLNDIRSSSAYVLFYQRRPRGAQVQSEAEIEAAMQQYATEKRATLGYSSRYTSSSSTDLD